MEKRRPHTPLPTVKALVEAGKIRFTGSAINGADELGMDRHSIIATVLALTMQDFFKSMTTHANYKEWQDVYRPLTAAGTVYLKLTVSDGVLIVSFKEL